MRHILCQRTTRCKIHSILNLGNTGIKVQNMSPRPSTKRSICEKFCLLTAPAATKAALESKGNVSYEICSRPGAEAKFTARSKHNRCVSMKQTGGLMSRVFILCIKVQQDNNRSKQTLLSKFEIRLRKDLLSACLERFKDA